MKKHKYIIPVLTVFLLSLPTVLPLLLPGFFAMHDDTQVSRIYLMARSLTDGMFPVRWVEDLGYGYGYPIFNFYAPLAYYLGGFLSIISGDALLATKLVFIFTLIGAGFGMYYFIRKFFGDIPAVAAAITYVYFPYHAVNTYVRGALSELTAYVFLPLLFSSFYSLYYSSHKTLRGNMGSVLLLGVSLGLIILSHNLSAYMVFFFFFLLGVVGLYFRKDKATFLWSLILSVGLGLLLSAFYWLPAILEMRFTDVLSQVGGGSDFRDHFVCLTEFWKTNWGYTGSVPGCTDGMSFTVGKSTLILLPVIFAMLFYLLWKRALRNPFLVVTAGIGLLTSFVLMQPVSRIVWELVPKMEYLQFPWRFLNFFSLFFAVLLGIFIAVIEKKFSSKFSLAFAAGIIIITIGLYTRLFVPQEIFPRDATYYTDRTYIGYTVTKRSDEYLPVSFVPLKSADEIPQEKLTAPDFVQVTEIENKTGEYTAELTSSESARVLFNIAYFPAWRVLIDRQEVPITVEKRGISVQVPDGMHLIQAEFRQTPVEITGNILSLVGFLSIILGIIVKQRYENRKTT